MTFAGGNQNVTTPTQNNVNCGAYKKLLTKSIFSMLLMTEWLHAQSPMLLIPGKIIALIKFSFLRNFLSEC